MAATIPEEDSQPTNRQNPQNFRAGYAHHSPQPHLDRREDRDPSWASSPNPVRRGQNPPAAAVFDNFALACANNRSHDYGLVCAGGGFSGAHARYVWVLVSMPSILARYQGLLKRVDSLSESRLNKFRDIFLMAIDSPQTYMSSEYLEVVQPDLIQELCNATSFSPALNARIVFEIMQLTADYANEQTKPAAQVVRRGPPPLSRNSKEIKMSSSSNAARSSTNKPSNNQPETTMQETVKTIITPANDQNVNTGAGGVSPELEEFSNKVDEFAKTAGHESTGAAPAPEAEAKPEAAASTDEKPRYAGTRKALDKSTYYAKKAAAGITKATVVASTAIVVGEIAFFTVQSMRGRDYTIGDGLRTIGGLFARKAVEAAESMPSQSA